jgi:hypothetical protein
MVSPCFMEWNFSMGLWLWSRRGHRGARLPGS